VVSVESRADLLERYADVAVRVGANVQPGQPLVVIAQVEAVALARAVMAAGWRAGAANVEVLYFDEYSRYLLAKHGADDMLERTPVAARATLEASLVDEGASVNVIGDFAPSYFDDLDQTRAARTQPREARELAGRLMNERREAWTVIASADAGWAERVFGDPAVDRLWDEIAHACRLDEPDPVAAWRAHLATLKERTALLDERRFDSIRFRGPGTDLTIGLLPESRWIGGEIQTAWGQSHCPNLPTEEVFTTPDRRRAEGTIRATRPVAYAEGVIVEGMELRFADGRIEEARATAGEEFLLRHLDTDEGAHRLGELALVAESPVGDSGLLYYHTLFDENATSHLAYGRAYTVPVAGADEIDPAEHEGRGLNTSIVHLDFPVGGEDVEVDGVDGSGERVEILRGREWLLGR
jgi:aminopeptidase